MVNTPAWGGARVPRSRWGDELRTRHRCVWRASQQPMQPLDQKHDPLFSWAVGTFIPPHSWNACSPAGTALTRLDHAAGVVDDGELRHLGASPQLAQHRLRAEEWAPGMRFAVGAGSRDTPAGQPVLTVDSSRAPPCRCLQLRTATLRLPRDPGSPGARLPPAPGPFQATPGPHLCLALDRLLQCGQAAIPHRHAGQHRQAAVPHLHAGRLHAHPAGPLGGTRPGRAG